MGYWDLWGWAVLVGYWCYWVWGGFWDWELTGVWGYLWDSTDLQDWSVFFEVGSAYFEAGFVDAGNRLETELRNLGLNQVARLVAAYGPDLRVRLTCWRVAPPPAGLLAIGLLIFIAAAGAPRRS